MTKARSNATANAAKGDLTVGNGTNLSGVLAVGNNGETLVADSSTSTGLRWIGNIAAGKNRILNSAMEIAQRGTSISVGSSSWSTYTLDRYKLFSANSATTVSRDTSAPTGFNYSAKIQRPAGNTGTNSMNFVQIVETANTTILAGQTVTLSFWVKKGANYSGGNVGVAILTGTGTDQGGDPYGWTGLAAPINDTSYSPTTSFVRLAYSGTIASNVKELAINLSWTGSGTAGADDALYITGIQLEVGAMTSFQTATGTIQGESAACQRYYWRYAAAANANTPFVMGIAYSTTAAQFTIPYPVTMRTIPATLDYSGVVAQDVGTGTTYGFTAMAINQAGVNSGQIVMTGGSGLTQYRGYLFKANNTVNDYIGLSAEL